MVLFNAGVARAVTHLIIRHCKIGRKGLETSQLNLSDIKKKRREWQVLVKLKRGSHHQESRKRQPQTNRKHGKVDLNLDEWTEDAQGKIKLERVTVAKNIMLNLLCC